MAIGRYQKFVACALAAFASIANIASAQQDPPKEAGGKPVPAAAPKGEVYKTKTAKLTDEKAIKEKSKEKNEALKAEGGNIAAVDEYYRDYLLPKLTQSTPDVINEAKTEIFSDIVMVELKSKANKELIGGYNTMLIKQLREIVFRDKEGKAYHPAARINAAVILGRLNSVYNQTSAPIPEAKVHETMLTLIDARELDGLVSSALTTLLRHVRPITPADQGKNEPLKKNLVAKLDAYLKTPVTSARTQEASLYLQEQIVDLLATIAKVESGKETESSKEALRVLKPLALKSIELNESEWLVEHSLLGIGVMKSGDLSVEEATALEKNVAKFILSSQKDWRTKISRTAGSVAGISGLGGGSLGSGGGLGSGGMGGGRGGGRNSGGGGSGGSLGGEESGLGGGTTDSTNKDKKPKEVKNARRMMHQRLERIHVALNGQQKKQTEGGPKKPAEPVGMIVLSSDVDRPKVEALIEAVEKLQSDLNNDKITDLNKLKSYTFKANKALKDACNAIIGETKDKKDDESEDENGDAFGLDSGSGGGSGSD